MKIDAPWLTHPGSVRIMAALTEAGHGAWFVGGCVRNELLRVPVADIDITTDAPPDRVMDLAGAAGLRPVPTGIQHGTVTVIADGKVHEVTTLRRDVETDGRHARVAFTDDIATDAARRDFTMNALYAHGSGTVLDPTGEGLTDLRAGRLRFIGDAAQRIAEDYLRILRFFRFHAWYADRSGGIDADGLAACAAGQDGLDRVSAERVGHEILRLLAAPDPAPAVAAMAQAGILSRILPGAEATGLAPLVALEHGAAPDPIRRLAVLGGDDPSRRLRLSNAQARLVALLGQAARGGVDPAEIAWRHGPDIARDATLVRAALAGASVAASTEARIARGAAAVFPVKAADLMPDLEGPALGAALARMETRWIASDFSLDRDALLADAQSDRG